MKQKLIIATILLLSCTSVFSKQRIIERTMSIANAAKAADIEVMLMNGAISIEGYKGDKIQVIAKIDSLDNVTKDKSAKDENPNDVKSEGSKKSMKGLKKVTNTAIQLELESRGNTVSIGSLNKKQKIDLVLRVPFNSNLELQLVRGDDIIIKNIHGSIDVQNVKGEIRATGIKGPIVAETLQKGLFVVFDEFDTKKPSSLNSHRGTVDVSYPKKSKVLIEIKTYQGEIYSGIDAEFESVDSVEENQGRENHSVTTIGGVMAAVLNGGAQKTMINTFKGDVIVRSH